MDVYEVIYYSIKDMLVQNRFYICSGDYKRHSRRSVGLYAYIIRDNKSGPIQPRSIFTKDINNIRVTISADQILVETWHESDGTSNSLLDPTFAFRNRSSHKIGLDDPLFLDIINGIICNLKADAD